ncbi:MULTISPECIES: MerR family transcriptional regulator [Halomonas]|jgi:DNA-binding transcriptional MerR regulator|uniref:MerR family transcriptional regulator n=1 Tax=Halomonas litopenaei TaxID=2109328 RepID=A0ABX5IT08_9GAMM|nr:MULTISPECIES: MerR family transcriptional regulator [Halomonas]MBR9772076.1 MerR family transcriptional regulator [Gammaproteobacteria bacterium]KJZ18738.1 MerR family transcriptional regulator [Halomonas sp. S2151]MAR72941.1 MerR family transcriptional regulator [Halomonas sp.]MBR9881344.1 MerR family transcriptional regulator [Gammaproteobacteria bacterium]MBY5942587.1 MerR family transcriptional regulator [Halomonas sp. DP5N14-9]|tara:strand:- start:1867 stop:2778 length:912 start_codon:yes stop_codon:yes gene_type:complete
MSHTAPPTESPLYPIREVSRLTGVNSVTLRAWERRYGLIEPRRTPKGHRLYAREDIERVERILQWLNRGVPVSQVKDLLTQPEPAETAPPAAGDWTSQRRQMLGAVDALDMDHLDGLYQQSLALYPVGTCISELWQPVVQELEERWEGQLGAALQRRSLESFLRTRIGIRLFHANRTARGSTLLLDTLPDDDGSLWTLMLALAASERGYRIALMDAPLPFTDLPLALERLRPGAVVLCSGKAERSDVVRRLLPRLAEQLDTPLALCGPVARIRAAELADSQIEVLGDDIPMALDRLRPLIRQH